MNRTQRKVRRQYKRIRRANARLEMIRVFCDHENVERVNYEVRVGSILEGQLVCADCGELLDDEGGPTFHLNIRVNTKEK